MLAGNRPDAPRRHWIPGRRGFFSLRYRAVRAVAFSLRERRDDIPLLAEDFIEKLNRHAGGSAEAKASEQMVRMMGMTPLGRQGTGDEIASVAEFLCSPGASYVSGCDIKVDGGILGRLALG